MANIIQKILLPKYQVTIFDAIKNNAKSIEYMKMQDIKFLKIFTPTLELVAKKDYAIKKCSYHFAKYASDGKVLNINYGDGDAKSDQIFNKMLKEYIAYHKRKTASTNNKNRQR